MNIEYKHIITVVLVLFKIAVILNFIIKYRKMRSNISKLEELLKIKDEKISMLKSKIKT